MKRLILISGIVVLGLIATTYWFVFKPPFWGVKSIGAGEVSSNRCLLAEEQLNNFENTDGYLVGRLTNAVYWGSRIFLRLETLSGETYSLLVIPKELGRTISINLDDPNPWFFQLKFYYLSFCGQPKMFSTEIVENGKRLENPSLDQEKQIFTDLIESSQLVAALVINQRDNLIFDRSGPIFLHLLDIYPAQP